MSVSVAIDHLLSSNASTLESVKDRECEYCALHRPWAKCKGCPVKATYKSLQMGFEIAEKMASRKRDIVRA